MFLQVRKKDFIIPIIKLTFLAHLLANIMNQMCILNNAECSAWRIEYIVLQIIGMWILDLYSNYVSKTARIMCSILCRCRSLTVAQHFIVQIGKEPDLLLREGQQQSIIQHIDIDINIDIKEIGWNGRLRKRWWCRGHCGSRLHDCWDNIRIWICVADIGCFT